MSGAELNWAYVFSLLSHYYGFTVEEILKLTPKQVFNYIMMIRYVCPFSKDVGKMPPVPETIREKIEKAKKLGLRVPSKGV